MFDLISDVTGLLDELRQLRAVLTRACDVLDRIAPPPLPRQDDAPAAGPTVATMAESPEEYEIRQSSEASLAASLGLAPWSRQFQDIVFEMRRDLMKSGYTYDEAAGRFVPRGELGEREADGIIRQAFQEAFAQQQQRSG